MDPDIETVLREGLRREGWPAPAAKHPADRGGWTRGGITAGNWGAFRRLGRPATPGELDDITEAEALDFYYRQYVKVPGYDGVPDGRLQALLVDWAFTSWHDDPTKALQQSLADRGLYAGAVDGAFGPKTRAALSADRDPRQTYRDVYNARIDFYVDLALDKHARALMRQNKRTQLHFLRGWVRRCLEFTP